MYAALAQTVVEQDARVLREVERLRSRHPRSSDAEIVRRLTARAAWRCGLVAAAVSAAAQLLDPRVAAADLSFQTLSLARLAHAIARARRRPTTTVERGCTAAASLVVAGTAGIVRRTACRGAGQALRRNAPNLVPVVSAVIGGLAAYASARLFGRALNDLACTVRRRR